MIAIRYYREKSSMTQMHLACILGVKPNTVTQWESGDRKPNVLMLKKIAVALNCTADELLEHIN